MRPGRTGGVAQVAEHLLASMRPSIQALELSKKKKKKMISLGQILSTRENLDSGYLFNISSPLLFEQWNSSFLKCIQPSLHFIFLSMANGNYSLRCDWVFLHKAYKKMPSKGV
jgi:hypothetical protein